MSDKHNLLNRPEADPAIRRRILIAVALFLGLILILSGLFELTKNAVAVEQNGEKVTVRTHESTVADLLESLEIHVGEHDLIEPSLQTEIESGMDIVYKPAAEVTLSVAGEETTVYTVADNVNDLFTELGIEPKAEDEIEPSGDTPIEDGLHIAYSPAVLLTFAYDGNEGEYWSTSATVADFLKEANVELGELDRVEPALDEELRDGLDIRLIRVEKVTDVIEEPTAFETLREEDSDLNHGVERVVEKGKKGKQALHYEVTLEDGVEVDRQLVKTETVEESENRVIAVGTKQEEAKEYVSETQTAHETVSQEPVDQPVSEPEKPKQESAKPQEKQEVEQEKQQKTLQMQSTAYTAACDGCSGITATGIDLNSNANMKVIAVDPSVIPLGTRVHVEGYGEAIAGDTGGAIKGNKIDVHVPTKEDATNYGSKSVKVTILD
ncbi:ubiquitin-like domain-containing protein [Shouchella clausii]|uniref:G5 and 3D domain-containing protein n=1 Tax=Shouchella TaxID=2893057 RepID=UPI0004E78D39|nr:MULTISPECIES: G5 and 3D domain-containing protein [Shouchella]ALA52813.1 Cell wall-binding protein [Shouchella clausii]MDP0462120.1 ubiquitin-like domain-containing protein [Shouchella rhizosphaerae]MDP5259470.1 ubiquitin-like domain-containing protein [Shouchella clausii]MDP5267326.1 ubiquitin-like domain-containing protein [Shouchella clausii]MDP5285109.1 ubiquitin-like domain-containing protein [Shouchella clausii]